MQPRRWLSPALPVAIFIASITVVAQQPGSRAVVLFDEVAQTIRNAGPVRVESSLVLESRIGEVVERSDPLVAVYVLDGAHRGLVRLNGWRLTADAGQVIIEHDHDPGAFVRLEQDGSPLATIRSAFRSLPDPYLALALGSEDPESLVGELHDEPLDLVPVDSESGMLLLQGDSSSLQLTLDAVGRPVEGTLLLEGDMAAGEVELKWTWTWSHASLSREELEAAIRFERRGRQRLDDPLSLRRRVTPGQGARGIPMDSTPELRLKSDGGDVVDLGDFEGHVVLVEFWASWCGPCMRALPAIEEQVNHWQEEGREIVLLAVNTLESSRQGDGPVETGIVRARRVRKALGFEAPILLDEDEAIAAAWGVKGLPVVFVVDPSGNVVSRIDGHRPGVMDELARAVESALEEAGGSAPRDRGE